MRVLICNHRPEAGGGEPVDNSLQRRSYDPQQVGAITRTGRSYSSQYVEVSAHSSVFGEIFQWKLPLLCSIGRSYGSQM